MIYGFWTTPLYHLFLLPSIVSVPDSVSCFYIYSYTISKYFSGIKTKPPSPPEGGSAARNLERVRPRPPRRCRACCRSPWSLGSRRAGRCRLVSCGSFVPGGRFAVVTIDLQGKLISCDHHSTSACAEALGLYAFGSSALSSSPHCLTARKGAPPDGAVVPRSDPNGALRAKGSSGAPIYLRLSRHLVSAVVEIENRHQTADVPASCTASRLRRLTSESSRPGEPGNLDSAHPGW